MLAVLLPVHRQQRRVVFRTLGCGVCSTTLKALNDLFVPFLNVSISLAFATWHVMADIHVNCVNKGPSLNLD